MRRCLNCSGMCLAARRWIRYVAWSEAATAATLTPIQNPANPWPPSASRTKPSTSATANHDIETLGSTTFPVRVVRIDRSNDLLEIRLVTTLLHANEELGL